MTDHSIADLKTTDGDHPTNLRDLTQAQRLTPAQRRIAQCLFDQGDQAAHLSSSELAELADVSQPSVTRFAVALGFKGYLEMRRSLRMRGAEDDAPSQKLSRYQSAALVEARNLTDLSAGLADTETMAGLGKALMGSRPLTVVGLRAAAGLATHFGYFAAKFHADIRPIVAGGSLIDDQLEQAKAAGGTWALVFLIPLYPRESLRAIQYARELGLKVAVIADRGFDLHDTKVDLALTAPISSSLTFDSHAACMILASVILDAMCEAEPKTTQARLDANERSSTRRKVFVS